MAETFTPTKFHHSLERPEEEKLNSGQYAKEFMVTMRQYMEVTKSGVSTKKNAEIGSRILQDMLIFQQYNPETFRYNNIKSFFHKHLGENPSQEALKEVEGLFTGFRGELGAVAAARELGFGVYHTTTREDMRGIDLILDSNPLELEDYLTKGSESLPEAEQTYDYVMASVKCSGMFPAVGDFPVYLTCRTLQELTDQLDEGRDAYYDYFRKEGFREDIIDENWEHTYSTAVKAGSRLHGMSADGSYANGHGLTERYDNVVPAVILIPGAETLIQPNGEPKAFTKDRFLRDVYK